MAIFIGGYARTGTTLMQGIICSDHNTFPATKESRYLLGLLAAYAQGCDDWIYHTDDYFDAPDDFFRFHQHIVKQYLEQIQVRWGHQKRIVQKCPAMTPYFPDLLQFVDDSVFIVLVRDPRDTMASYVAWMAREQAPRPDIQHLLVDYARRYQRLLEHRHHFGERLLLVHYEELVHNNASVMAQLRDLTQLKLPINPHQDAWEHRRNPKLLGSASHLDGRPISDASIGGYDQVLTPAEILYLEENAQGLNSIFGCDIYLADSENRHKKITNIYLSQINLVVFPNFTNPEQCLVELENLIEILFQHPERQQISLIFDVDELSEDIQDNILSLCWKYMLEHDLGEEQPLEISMASLGALEWMALRPSITARLLLSNENSNTKYMQPVSSLAIDLLPQVRFQSRTKPSLI